MLKQVCKKCLYTFEGTGDICPECLEKKKQHQDYIGSMYYVYEFIRLDTNEPFYVGKGQGNRAFRKIPNARETRLNEIINELRLANSDYVVNIVEKDILDEIEAFNIEKDLIEEYTFDYGYDLKNIIYSDIIGFKQTIKESWNNEEKRQLAKERTEELWKDNNFREKVTTNTKEAMQDEITRMKCSNGAKKAWEDEEYRAKITAVLKRPRKSAPKTKAKVKIVNVVTGEVIVDVEGMTNAKNEMSKLGFGSKKFAKLRNGEIFEDLQLIKN